MGENIKFSLLAENRIRNAFLPYIPLNKPEDEIINMFLADLKADRVNYKIIAKNEQEMRKKLKEWLVFYRAKDVKRSIPKYKKYETKLKRLLVLYGFENNDAQNIFIHDLTKEGINEKEAYRIASIILEQITEGER